MTYTIEGLEQMMRENGGNLDLRYSSVTSLPNGLTVEGNLDLEGTPIASLPDNLTVGGSLWLSGTPISSLPENLTVGSSLYLSYTPITTLPSNLTVGDRIDLRYTLITSLPESLTVGSSLYLSYTPITTLPDNLTVGGILGLSGTKITSLPSNLAVGGEIISDGGKIKNSGHYKLLQNGDYVEGKYLFADGILTHVKRAKKIGEYTFYIGKIPDTHVLFDGKYYAHCTTFREGVRDIEFKRASDRGSDQYRSLTLDSEVSKDEAITMYRVITGACQQGTESFVSSLETTKDRYAIREMISITQGQYGSRTFAEFFDRDN